MHKARGDARTASESLSERLQRLDRRVGADSEVSTTSNAHESNARGLRGFHLKRICGMVYQRDGWGFLGLQRKLGTLGVHLRTGNFACIDAFARMLQWGEGGGEGGLAAIF